MARVAVMSSFKEYCTSVAASVVKQLLYIKIDPEDKGKGISDPFHICLYAENDGRLKNKVYTWLESEKVLNAFVKSEENRYTGSFWHYSHSSKPTYHWSGTVNKEWFEKTALTLATEPVFEVKATKKGKESWSKDVIAEEFDSYKEISDLKDSEVIWLYYHLDEYDIHRFSQAYSSSRGGTNTVKKIEFLPKKLLSTTTEAIFLAKVKEYCGKHMEWAVEHVLGLKDDVINKMKLDSTPNLTFDDPKQRTAEHLTKTITKTYFLIENLKIAFIALQELERKIRWIGGWEVLEQRMYDELLVYLKDNYPLHIAEGEEDDMKELCRMVVEGKDRGINPRIQELEKMALTQ